jgi:hypothetical protein
MPPFFVKAKFVPWYRSVIIAAGVGVAIWMWVAGYQPGHDATGTANIAWIPLLVVAYLMCRWHVQAEREWKVRQQRT